MSIGENLRKLRKERGLTQKVVADSLKISRSVYSEYETNDRVPSVNKLISLSRFYMTTLDYICGNIDREIIDITNLDDINKIKIKTIIKENQSDQE